MSDSNTVAFAALMAFLISPAVRWLTGSSLRMDGGEVKSAVAIDIVAR